MSQFGYYLPQIISTIIKYLFLSEVRWHAITR